MLLLFAAASFACLNPTHHDGDAIRCDGIDKAMRLHGIDAPEMPGACRPGRACTPGDPYAARDHLESLTRGRNVVCEQVDTDHYGRRVVECRADGTNIACEMIADGYAVERYGYADCRAVQPARALEPDRSEPSAPPASAESVAEIAAEPAPAASAPVAALAASLLPEDKPSFPWRWALLWPIILSLIGLFAMALDKERALASTHRRVRRVPERTLLLIAALGGSPGVLLASRLLNHKNRKPSFVRSLRLILIVQLGLMLLLLFGSR